MHHYFVIWIKYKYYILKKCLLSLLSYWKYSKYLTFMEYLLLSGLDLSAFLKWTHLNSKLTHKIDMPTALFWWGNKGTDKLGDFPKIIVFESDRGRIWNLDAWTLGHHTKIHLSLTRTTDLSVIYANADSSVLHWKYFRFAFF